MRIGKPLRSSRGWSKASIDENKPPQHISSATVVGRLNPDIIASVYAPYITRVAEESLEKYVHEVLVYEELVRDVEQHDKSGSSETIDPDGLIRFDADGVPIAPRKPLFSSRFNIDEAHSLFKETSEHFFTKSGGYRAHLNTAKFERLLDEKYGRFRPFITAHPEVERFLRSVQRKYAARHFSPFRQGDPPIPRSTAVIILFMMQRGKMRWEVMVLATLFFLIGLQPWALVGLVALGQTLLSRRRGKALGSMPSQIPAVEAHYTDKASKEAKLLEPVGTRLDKVTDKEAAVDASQYDAIILGTGPSALYAAALLSRAGRRVLVLSSREDASGCITMEKKFQSIPFDVEASNVGKVSKIQSVLAPALATTTDTQGGVRFCKIGSEYDGHAFQILSIFGVGTESYDQDIPFVLRADGGLDTLMDDAALQLGDGWPTADGGTGNSATGAFVHACEKMNASANQFYMCKVLPEKWHSFKGAAQYQECSIRYAQSFFDQAFPLNAHARSLLAGIGLVGENVRPKAASMAPYVTNVCAALSGEGMHYPVGGPRALGHALTNVVERNGGRVLTGVQVAQLVFGKEPAVAASVPDEKKDDVPGPCPRCLGVQLSDGTNIAFDEARCKATGGKEPSPVVISMEGFLTTFIGLLSDGIRTKFKVPRGLPALTSRRPVFKVLFYLNGTAEDLNVTGADYYRLPNAAIAQDEADPATNTIKYGEIGWPDTTTESLSAESESTSAEVEVDTLHEPDGENRRSKRSSGATQRKLQFNVGSSWLQISFPSAKDPSFAGRHGKVTTCVATIEADDDFVTFYDAQPKLYGVKKTSSTDLERLLERVKRDLVTIFPQTEGKIAHAEVAGPFRRGLSHNPERYAAKGIRADTPYPGLFMGGNDLTVGESFSGDVVGGWLVANAVCDYSPLDHLMLQKNITADIQQFLDPPLLDEEEDDEDDEDVKDKDV